MSHTKMTVTCLQAVILALFIIFSTALSSALPVSAEDNSGITSDISASESFSRSDPAAAVSEYKAENGKSIDPFSFLFGFLVPVLAVVTFLIFFIVTRTARLKKRHSEAKHRLISEETNGEDTSDT